MGELSYLRRLFLYDDWANGEALASVRAAGVPLRSLRYLAHIVGAERLWLDRLERRKQKMPVWPELTVEQCAQALAELPPLWREFFDGLDEAGLSRPSAYVNTKGQSWSNTVDDVLMHVVMHSAYHRGQIATDVRASGHTPAYTDFIHCVRQGLVS